MLKSVTLRDFFSFKGEKTIQLNTGLNLLLGINGSGKTSFINALRLLCEGIGGAGLEKLIQEQWGGYAQVANCNGDRAVPYVQVTYEFDYRCLNALNAAANFASDVFYRITLRPSGNSYTLGELVYTEHQQRPERQFRYLDFNNGNGRISTREENGNFSFQEYTGADVSGQELALRQINDPIHYLPTHTLRRAIAQMVAYADFNVGEGSRLRRPAEFTTYERLLRSGENLTQILNGMKLNHFFDFERLEEAFRSVNPQYKSIEFSNLYGQAYLSLHERNMRRAIGALHMSDGTLRFLLLGSIFYNPLRGALVAVDEPERGLHPDMIRSVAAMMKHAARQGQVIAATHSPHLLNQFDLEDVLVFEKDEENSTVVRTFTEEDFPDWEGEYLPGQLWLMGQIGGKRW